MVNMHKKECRMVIDVVYNQTKQQHSKTVLLTLFCYCVNTNDVLAPNTL